MKVFIVFTLALAYASASASAVDDVINPVQDNHNVGITRGHNASPRQFPYQVALTMQKGNNYTNCGGSLISNTWVLTAAHCTYGVDNVMVLLGSIYRNSPLVIHTIDKNNIINHEHYTKTPTIVKDDIALIRIPHVQYTKDIQPVKLPKYEERTQTYAGHQSIITGWGDTLNYYNRFPNTLQYSMLSIMSNNECYRYWGSTLLSSNICVATPQGSSTCYGDSGGPLVEYPSWVQVGVTSYVTPYGCDKGYPAVFTRVTDYLDWIKQHTGIKL